MLGALVLGAVAVVGAGVGGAALGDTAKHFLTGKDFHSTHVLALTSAVWFLLLAVSVGAALLAARRWPERRGWIAAGVVALAALDMLHFAIGYQPMAPASAVPPKTGAIAFLQQHRDDGRMLGLGATLLNDYGLTYGLRDIRGYDPPQPSARYFRLWREAEAEQLDWTGFTMEALSPVAMQVASVLGARWVVTEPGVTLPEGGGAAVHALRVAYDGRDARVFENSRAMPPAMVAQRVRVVPGEAAARAALAEPAFDPRREVVVERGAMRAGTLGPSSGHVTVADRSNADVTVRASLSRPGLVVLNDSWAPGWGVQVDGHDARAVRVNDVMRGVAVPAGPHEVEWRYRVPGLQAGALLSVLTLLVLVGLGSRARASRQRAY